MKYGEIFLTTYNYIPKITKLLNFTENLLLKCIKKENMINNENYEHYLDSWLNGIVDEIRFWDTFFSTKGSICKVTEEEWKEVISYERQFTLEDDLELLNTKFLDVGSGPYSSCGSLTKKTNLELYAVDPLASVYKKLKEQHDIKTSIVPETAMVENLSAWFQENTFDITHMSNSLDHSFDPMLGIWQMLWVTKIGGKVILRHHQNEAENENYIGFHQWNLSVEDGRFIIWRGNKRIDVEKEINQYSEIVAIEKDKEAGNKVVIKKIHSSPFYFNENFSILLEKFLEKICDYNLNIYFKNKNTKKQKNHLLKNLFKKFLIK